jgi:flagellar hook-associated protein 3 FlgL
MRVTDTNSGRNFLLDTARQRQQMNLLSNEMSSGRKLSRPSDDPIGAQQSLAARSGLTRLTQYGNNVQSAQSQLQSVDSIADSFQLTLDKALQLTVQGLSGSTTATQRATLSSQINDITKQVMSLGNSAVAGQYLFAGTKTNTTPFTQSGGTVTYNGNTDPILTRIDDNTLVQTNVDGQDLFAGSKDVFATLNTIQQGLTANDTTAIQNGLADLRAVIDHTNVVRGQVGATLDHLQSRANDIQQQNVQLTADKSKIEDANIVEVAVKSTQAQTALQASMAAGARLVNLSLLDFLK